MSEHFGAVTFRNTPLTLLGERPLVGEQAPLFTAQGVDLADVSLGAFAGRPLILASAPSLDTPACDMQTRRFNQEAASLPTGPVVLTITMDLPFAQRRWCGSAGVDRVVTLSDHRDAAFGKAYGLLIKELRLLARAVFVLNAAHEVAYVELVPELTQEPQYGAALDVLRTL